MDDTLPGTWVQDRSGRWHRSTTFDGYEHGLACDVKVSAKGVDGVETDTSTVPTSGTVCRTCQAVRRKHLVG